MSKKEINFEKRKKDMDLFSNKPSKKNTQGFNLFFWLIVVFLVVLVFSSEFGSASGDSKPLNEFIKNLKEDKVSDVTVSGDDITVKLTDDTTYVVKKETNSTIDDILSNNQVPVDKIKGKLII